MENFSREIAIIFSNPWVVKFAIASTTMQIIHPEIPAVSRTAPKPRH
ncbi:MAG: hypothetical protein KKD99_12090 [Proteobacteria bacterium]|nr:hypothetical protein [Pseudomonadota bacterium]MBU4449316.1 hypothetical protein [Pseudomonadota bacterium]